jgi:non-specific serine/threonine protein kinase
VKAFSVEQIKERLDDRFRLLTGGSRTALPRQQTLRALVDWSYGLLSETEQALLHRLSVFAGGWSLEAEEAVCAGDGVERHELLDLLPQLVDKSPVLAEAQGGTERYRMLETIRQYAAEKLAAARQEAVIRDRHLAYFLALAEEAEPELLGPAQRAWLVRLGKEHSNLRAALRWSAEGGDTQGGLRVAVALAQYWIWRGEQSEGHGWFETLLSRSAGGSGRDTEDAQPTGARLLRAKALCRAGLFTEWRGDYAQAEALCQEGLALSRELGDRREAALSLWVLSLVAARQGDIERAVALAEDSLAGFRELGDRWFVPQGAVTLGTLARLRGEFARSEQLFREGLALHAEAGNKMGMASALVGQGHTALQRGDFARATAFFREGLVALRDVEAKPWLVMTLAGLVAVARAEGGPGRAARLIGLAEAVQENPGALLFPPPTRDAYERDEGAVRAALGEEAFGSARAAGRALAPEDAVAYALGEATSLLSTISPQPETGPDQDTPAAK